MFSLTIMIINNYSWSIYTYHGVVTPRLMTSLISIGSTSPWTFPGKSWYNLKDFDSAHSPNKERKQKFAGSA
jgi:hypothetical protein